MVLGDENTKGWERYEGEDVFGGEVRNDRRELVEGVIGDKVVEYCFSVLGIWAQTLS